VFYIDDLYLFFLIDIASFGYAFNFASCEITHSHGTKWSKDDALCSEQFLELF
jgi:hypothetical protein